MEISDRNDTQHQTNVNTKTNTNHQNDFRIVAPGVNALQTMSAKAYINDEPNLDYIDPNNIMSDPVIMEEFRKLYAENEYFQQVHRKCCEWLLKYVIPDMEERKTKGNLNHENY